MKGARRGLEGGLQVETFKGASRGLQGEKGGRGRRNRVTRSGGVGGGAQPPPEARRDGREGFGKEEGDCSPPQKQDVTEEKGLEKKRVIEGEGSGFPPEARRDGREGFGKEEGD